MADEERYEVLCPECGETVYYIGPSEYAAAVEEAGGDETLYDDNPCDPCAEAALGENDETT